MHSKIHIRNHTHTCTHQTVSVSVPVKSLSQKIDLLLELSCSMFQVVCTNEDFHQMARWTIFIINNHLYTCFVSCFLATAGFFSCTESLLLTKKGVNHRCWSWWKYHLSNVCCVFVYCKKNLGARLCLLWLNCRILFKSI